ncbi:hypothetical protein [Roseobacter sp. MH60115]|uniref:hypothetical protein n=1 Tax=Roseobacter sp. MH60115 TaxID=2785324 RepID=UPI0018A325A2|nr:hypothetical protein [Roseobacter sp. MH60115]
MTQKDKKSVREIARAAGLPPAPVLRSKTGQNVSLQTAAKMRPFVDNCPRCGMSAEADPKALIHSAVKANGERLLSIAENFKPKDHFEIRDAGSDYCLGVRHICDALREAIEAEGGNV